MAVQEEECWHCGAVWVDAHPAASFANASGLPGARAPAAVSVAFGDGHDELVTTARGPATDRVAARA